MNYSFHSDYVNEIRALERCARLDRFVSSKKLEVKKFENAVIVPQLGVCKNGALIPNSYWGGTIAEKDQTFDEKNDCIETKDIEVYYIGTFHPCWGHEITDGMRLLWGIISDIGGITLDENVKFAYSLCDLNHPIPNNFLRLLSFLGINETNLILVNKPIRFKTVYLADEAYWYKIDSEAKRTYSDTYRALFEYVCKKVVPKKVEPSRIVYFSRTAWKKGNPDFGESLLEKAFKQKFNCEVYHPEKLTFDELVKILRETKTLITTEGSISHNALFMQPGANLIIIRKAGFISYYQLMINQLKNLNVTYIDAHATLHFYNRLTPYYGPFFLYVNKALAGYLGIDGYFPLITYLRYRGHIIGRKIKNVAIRNLAKARHMLASS